MSQICQGIVEEAYWQFDYNMMAHVQCDKVQKSKTRRFGNKQL